LLNLQQQKKEYIYIYVYFSRQTSYRKASFFFCTRIVRRHEVNVFAYIVDRWTFREQKEKKKRYRNRRIYTAEERNWGRCTEFFRTFNLEFL